MMFKQLATHELACSRSHSRICSFLLLQQPCTLGLGKREDFPFHREMGGGQPKSGWNIAESAVSPCCRLSSFLGPQLSPLRCM